MIDFIDSRELFLVTFLGSLALSVSAGVSRSFPFDGFFRIDFSSASFCTSALVLALLILLLAPFGESDALSLVTSVKTFRAAATVCVVSVALDADGRGRGMMSPSGGSSMGVVDRRLFEVSSASGRDLAAVRVDADAEEEEAVEA